MAKTMKRGLSVLFVVAFLVSAMSLPVSAIHSAFRSNKGGMLEASMKQGKSCRVYFTFEKDGVAWVAVSQPDKGAPEPSFPKNAVTKTSNDSLRQGKIDFKGGEPGVYYYTLYLLDSSEKSFAQQSVCISVGY